MNIQEVYQEYVSLTQKAADLNNAAAVLGWDQETYMPPKGFNARGRQLATLATAAHEILTSERYGRILEQLGEAAELDEDAKTNVKCSREDFEKAQKLSPEFVEAMAKQSSASFEAWIAAREAKDYGRYAAELGKMIALKKEQAERYGYEAHPYDALLDDYEKGGTVAVLDPVFEGVKRDLPPLLERIAAKGGVDDSFFHKHYPKEAQFQFSLEILKAMGYDLEAGRQDYSEHPFSTSFAPTDVRVTTRVDEKNIASLLWSSIHEGGHALYEQGLPEVQYGLPLAQATSLSIHESQSRLWENGVGRSLPFWNHFFPLLQKRFPDQLKDCSAETWYRGANKVQPSLIRTESDELTYHFHVLIRYEIEKALLTGELDPKDLRNSWNEAYQKYLGVTPADDKQGVLQDVHWAHGSFGYFPTYSLGSFYAAQFLEKATAEIKDLDSQFEAGQFGQLLSWLREHVHQYGRRYRSEELCKRITGQGLDFQAFLRYAEQKFGGIYNLSAEPVTQS
jgi:carboxypeptidase Taq